MRGVGPLLAALATLTLGSACDRLPTAPRPLAASDPATTLAPRGARHSGGSPALAIPSGAGARDLASDPVDPTAQGGRGKPDPSVRTGCRTCQRASPLRRPGPIDPGGDVERGSSGATPRTSPGPPARFSYYAVAW
jgi:hypothetical protein